MSYKQTNVKHRIPECTVEGCHICRCCRSCQTTSHMSKHPFKEVILLECYHLFHDLRLSKRRVAVFAKGPRKFTRISQIATDCKQGNCAILAAVDRVPGGRTFHFWDGDKGYLPEEKHRFYRKKGYHCSSFYHVFQNLTLSEL